MNQPATISPSLRVVRYHDLDAIAPLASDWDRLSGGVPFRSWEWMSTWWRHFGQCIEAERAAGGELFVLGAFDQAGTLAGVAPWWLEDSPAHGRVLRFLGSGEVCSEYLSVLCEPDRRQEVTGAIAAWLTEAACADRDPGRPSDRWDLLELTAVDADDPAVAQLAERLESLGNTIHRQPGAACWRSDLSGGWEPYMARLSKRRRRWLRDLLNVFDSGEAAVHWAQDADTLERARSVLFDLHERRWQQAGQAGVFASPRVAAFHRDVTRAMFAAGKLCMYWVEMDRRPIAAEYALVGAGKTFAYQSGMDPALLADCPGHLANCTLLRSAMDRGDQTLDFLRGDEPYKTLWGAAPHPTVEIRAVPDRTVARWRHRVWLAGSGVKQWIKRLMRRGK